MSDVLSGYNCSTSGDKSGFVGCDRTFSALKYFDEHFTAETVEDDETRDKSVISVSGDRCKTDDELIAGGLEQRENGVWHNPEMTDKAKEI